MRESLANVERSSGNRMISIDAGSRHYIDGGTRPSTVKKCLVAISAFVALLSNIGAQTAAVPSTAEKAPIDRLIPWLLQEDAQLRGISFGEVIFDTTGKRVLVFNPKDEVDARVVKQI